MVRVAGGKTSIMDRSANTEHGRVSNRQAAAWIGDAVSARMKDILKVGLKGEAWDYRDLVCCLDQGLIVVDQCTGLNVHLGEVRRGAAIGSRNAGRIVRSSGYQAFKGDAAVGVEIDRVAIAWRT
jgi:hypothetical protein